MKMTQAQLKAFIEETTKAALGTTIEDFRKHQAEQAEKQAKDFGHIIGAIGQTSAQKAADPGIFATQAILCQAKAAYRAKMGQPVAAADLAKKIYGDEVAKALSASNLVEGGVLVAEQVSNDIIPLLRAATVVYAHGPRVVPMPSGVFSQPRMTAGSQASYIGENLPAPVTQPSTGAMRMTAKKLAALVPMSNDWLRRETAGGESAVRDDIVQSVSVRTDSTFIRNAGGVHSPRGLRFLAQAGNVFAANGTVNLANTTADIGQMVLRLANANVPMARPGWIAAPRTWNYLMTVRDANGHFAFRDEITAGRLWGFPFKYTTSVPVNLGGGTNESELYLVDFAEVYVGETTALLIDTSNEASYFDGASTVSAFQNDQTLMRVIIEHDIAMRQEAAVAVLTSVLWS